jgi:hypothetical protein
MEDGMTTDLPNQFDVEAENNNKLAQNLLERLFPDIDVPFDLLYQTLSYLAETKVNAQILPKVIRAVYNISIGTGMGQVVVHVNKEMVNVSCKETDVEIKTKVL